MAGKPPYFPFYPKDFAADSAVEAMTTREVGAYILLLCKAWHESPPGSIPDDDTVLARWARLDPIAWSECRSAVLAPFAARSDGRLYQKRMQKEYAKLSNLQRDRSEAGRKGAEVRWQTHADANGKNMPSGSGSGSGSGSEFEPQELEGKSDQEKIVGTAKGVAPHPFFDRKAASAAFAAFWAAYPCKAKKLHAARSWDTLAPGAELADEILAAVERQKKSPAWAKDGGAYIPHPGNWLDERRWEDEGTEIPQVPVGFQSGIDFAKRTEERRRSRDKG